MEHTVQWVGRSLDPVARSAVAIEMAMSRNGQPTKETRRRCRAAAHSNLAAPWQSGFDVKSH